MQVGQCRCVGPDFVDAAVQIVDLVFNACDAFIGLIELAAIDSVRAAGRKVTGCYVDNLLIVGVDAFGIDVSLVTDLVGRSSHAASDRSVAADTEVFFHSDYILKGGCAIEGGRAGDVERIRRRAASNGCTIVDNEFICRRCPVYSQVFLNCSVGFHGDVAFQVRRTIDCQVLANVCIALQVRIAFDRQVLIYRCITADTEVFQDGSIVHFGFMRAIFIGQLRLAVCCSNRGLANFIDDGIGAHRGADIIANFVGDGSCSRIADALRTQAAVTCNGRSLIAADSRGQVFANRVGHVFCSVVDDIFGIIGNRTVLSRVGDIFCRLGDAGGVGAIRYGTADRACCRIFYDVDEGGAAYQGIFHLSSSLRRSAVLGIAGFD